MEKLKDHLMMALLFLMALASHLPFLWAGHGREEDAWGMALIAKSIWETKVYEVSRLPGHPLYELLLAGLWPVDHSYFFFNLLSAVATALAVMLFYKIARFMGLRWPFLLALAFWFVPVFFVAGHYTIDYNFALCLILGSFLALLRRRFWLAAILLGLATGFRISSLSFLLPFTLIFWPRFRGIKNMALFWLLSVAVAGLCFLPPFLTYGLSFLDFHKPPFISWANILYKMSLGIWGVPLLVALLLFTAQRLLSHKRILIERSQEIPLYRIWIGVGLILLLQFLVFLRLPFKAEFFIPIVPFLLLLCGIYFSRLQLRVLAGAAFLSTFLFGFDYLDPYRGADPSTLAVNFKAGGQELFFDPLQGPAILDLQKRQNKSQLVDRVLMWQRQQTEPALLIAGWYFPELMLKTTDTSLVKMDYYSSAAELEKARQDDRKIFYLPEINLANARIKGHYLADSLGQPLLPQ